MLSMHYTTPFHAYAKGVLRRTRHLHSERREERENGMVDFDWLILFIKIKSIKLTQHHCLPFYKFDANTSYNLYGMKKKLMWQGVWSANTPSNLIETQNYLFNFILMIPHVISHNYSHLIFFKVLGYITIVIIILFYFLIYTF